MGTTPLKSLFNSWFSKQEIKFLMLGLDAAGKTTILYQLKLGEVIQKIPTIGFAIDTLEYKNIRFTAWDVGGSDNRMVWRQYCKGIQGIIFVVDASDKDRIDAVKEELIKILVTEELKDVPLLILANKSDKAVISIEELTQILDLKNLKRDWHIQRTCAITKDGLYEGFDWFSKYFKK